MNYMSDLTPRHIFMLLVRKVVNIGVAQMQCKFGINADQGGLCSEEQQL